MTDYDLIAAAAVRFYIESVPKTNCGQLPAVHNLESVPHWRIRVR